MKRIGTILLLTLSLFAFSQRGYNNFPLQPAQRSCGTPTLPVNFENWLQNLPQTNMAAKGPGGGGGNNTMSVFNIPVIVHVIHNNEAVNNPTATTGGNLNAAQIVDQINILNKDFNGTNADTTLIPSFFKPFLGKFQINFCLAVVNPTGGVLAEPGIDRINRNTMGWSAPPYSMTYYDNNIKAASIWNPNRYFNIWVSGLSGGLLGYATFPDPVGTGLGGLNPPYGTTTSDGVVILNTAFGSIGTASLYVPYNKGRTATHEVGHWLGLRHIWGDSNCGTDYCNDTPTQQTSNGGCPVVPKISCGNGPNGEMHMNYMDYTNDACMYMFTKDQKYRAQLILANSPMRVSLMTSTVCNLPSIGNDIGINFVTTPTYSQVINCSNKLTPVINLRNYGTTTINTATVISNVDGVNTQTIGWSGSLAPGAAVNYTLPQISNLVNGAHVFNATVTAPNGGVDNNNTNDIDGQLFTTANSFTLAATAATVCAGQSVTIVGSGGAASYSWNPGAIAGATAVVAPTVTTIYTLSGTSGTCVNTQTTTVTVSGSLVISVNNPTICSGNSAVITASGAVSYTWVAGPVSPSISVSPTSTAIYTVNGTSGSCSGSKTATVTVNTTPTVAVINTTICSGNAGTLTASGAATYSWSTGALTNTISQSPGSTTVYTVTGFNGTCSNVKTATISVNTTPTVTVANATICSGNSTVLTASGATSYSWSNGPVTNTISVNPTLTTVYSVTGTTGSCSNIKTATVTVNTTPTVAVINTTICSGNAGTLTASGAATYSWSTGALTNTISQSPGSTTVYTVTGFNGTCSNVKTGTISVNTTPTVTVGNATICSGNSTILTAGGATSYSWSNGPVTNTVSVNPALTTVYTVTGTTSGCTNVKTSTVTVNTTPTVSVNSATICSGSNATLTASGATSYSWSNGPVTNSTVVNPTLTTVYTVTGTTSGCVNIKTSTVNVSSPATINIPTGNVLCNGGATGTATINASGGATPYTYSYSTGAITQSVGSLAAGNYTAIVTTSLGCVSTKTFAITQPSALNVNTNIVNTSCGNCNGNITFTANGGTPSYTTTVTPGGSTINLCAGIYSVLTTDGNGCQLISSVNIGSSSTMTTVATSTNATCGGCNDGSASVTVTGGTGPYSYTWSPVGGNNSSATGLNAECYTVTITDAQACIKIVTVCVNANSTTTGLKTNALSQFNIYPNPTTGHITIEFTSTSEKTIHVIDVTGRLIAEERTVNAATQINLSDYSSGVYYIRIKDENGYHQFKIVKQ